MEVEFSAIFRATFCAMIKSSVFLVKGHSVAIRSFDLVIKFLATYSVIFISNTIVQAERALFLALLAILPSLLMFGRDVWILKRPSINYTYLDVYIAVLSYFCVSSVFYLLDDFSIVRALETLIFVLHAATLSRSMRLRHEQFYFLSIVFDGFFLFLLILISNAFHLISEDLGTSVYILGLFFYPIFLFYATIKCFGTSVGPRFLDGLYELLEFLPFYLSSLFSQFPLVVFFSKANQLYLMVDALFYWRAGSMIFLVSLLYSFRALPRYLKITHKKSQEFILKLAFKSCRSLFSVALPVALLLAVLYFFIDSYFFDVNFLFAYSFIFMFFVSSLSSLSGRIFAAADKIGTVLATALFIFSCIFSSALILARSPEALVSIYVVWVVCAAGLPFVIVRSFKHLSKR